MAPERNNQFKMLLSDAELASLRDLAEAQGLNVSDFLRQLIRREASLAALAAQPPTPSKPKAKRAKK